jgi:hypothetical protein
MTGPQVTERQMDLLREVEAGSVTLDLGTGNFLVDDYFYEGLSEELRRLCDAELIIRTAAGRATLPDFNKLPMVLTGLGAEVTR